MQKSIENKLLCLVGAKTATTERMLLLSSLFSVALTCFRVVYTGEILFVFLVWNLFLAWIPYAVSGYMIRHLQWLETNIRFFFGFMVWLLFLPNTFYIITDLFHLEPRAGIPYWYDLALIFSFAWNGLLLGILSMRDMEKMVAVKLNIRHEILFVLPIMFLNAIGIYVGRFLRYNSWDVITNPLGLVQDMLYLMLHPFRNRFDWSMIICYALFMSMVYLTLKRMAERR